MNEENLKQLLESVCYGIEYLLKKYTLTYEQLLSGNENNTHFHKEMLNLINANITSEEDMKSLQDYFRDNRSSLEYSKDIKSLFKLYFIDFFKSFYNIDNNGVTVVDKDKFIITTSEPIEKNPKIDDNRSPIIITKDGTSYVSPIDHIDLVNWFVLSENRDFNDDLRIVMYAKNGDFEVSSMYGYLPNKDMSPMHLSYDQAERMRDFYRYVCSKRKPVKSIDVILLTSSGLGLGKYDKPEENETSNHEARRNLQVLSNTFDKDEFDVSAYKSMITPFRENKII